MFPTRETHGCDTPTCVRGEASPQVECWTWTCPQALTQAPERDAHRGRSTRVTEHKGFLKKRVSGGSYQFFFLHQYLMLTKDCGTEPASPRSILSLAVADASPVPWADVEQSRCWRGPSAAGRSGKRAGRMTCTVTSPRDHCLSPVPGLLFLLCSPKTFL